MARRVRAWGAWFAWAAAGPEWDRRAYRWPLIAVMTLAYGWEHAANSPAHRIRARRTAR